MTANDLCHCIRESADHRRCDLTQLLADPAVFSAVVSRLAEPFVAERVAVVAGLDACGFALAGAVATRLGAGLVLLRKPDRAAWATIREEFSDYSGKSSAFHLVRDAIAPAARVLIVDDWSETGAQLHAAIRLVERAGAVVVGAAFVNSARQVRTDPRFQPYRLHAVLDYEEYFASAARTPPPRQEA